MPDAQYDADLRLHIDGAWAAGEGRDTGPVFNPATGAEIAAVPFASPADLDAALDAADRGFRLWRATDVEARGAILRKAAALMRER
ncbi:MAG TPA: aldehyde dehydrogenase family protein, partial [Sphingomonas sp.]|uniref:aldehyde dehydrogenase family protein n=1 Tax=Sphingomonas sp. TaxID=28214 RepID=UPI002ED9B25B